MPYCNCRKKKLSRLFSSWQPAETKISAGPSRITGPAELIEMVQYIYIYIRPHRKPRQFSLGENSI